MSGILPDISGKIDASVIRLFVDFAAVADTANWFLLGAASRDIFLHHLHGRPIRRKTVDVDLGVQLSSWRAYEDLTAKLFGSGAFFGTGRQHKLRHASGLELDVMPFGGIESPGNQIAWPSAPTAVMTVIGYDDIQKAAIKVKISTSPEVIVPVATLPGIAILKVIAWNDDRERRAKDISDLAYIADEYLHLDNWDRLEKGDSYLTEKEIRIQTVGAELLGRDMAKIASEGVRSLVDTLLREEISIGATARSVRLISQALDDRPLEECVEILSCIRAGLATIPRAD